MRGEVAAVETKKSQEARSPGLLRLSFTQNEMGAFRGFAQRYDFSWLLCDGGRKGSKHSEVRRLLQSRGDTRGQGKDGEKMLDPGYV